MAKKPSTFRALPKNERFVRLPGTSRNYRDTLTGLEVSRRQRDKIIDTQLGGRAKQEEPRVQRTRTGISARQARMQRNAERLGIPYDNLKTDKLTLQKLNRLDKDLRSKDPIKKRDALKTLGLREGIPDWVPPGMSEKYLQYKGKSHAKQRFGKKYGILS